MESYDVVMFVIVGIMILVGAWKGLAWQIAIVASIIVSFWVAISFEKSLADLLPVIDAPWNSYIAMILLYLGTSLGIWFLFACSARFIEKLELKGFERQMGAIIGVVNGILVCCVLTIFASMCGNEKLDTSLTRSKSAPYINHVLNQIRPLIPEKYSETVNPHFDHLQEILDREPMAEVEEQGSVSVTELPLIADDEPQVSR